MRNYYKKTVCLLAVIFIQFNAFSQNIYFINQSKRPVFVTKRTLLEEGSPPYELETTEKKVQSIPLQIQEAVYNVHMTDSKGGSGTNSGFYYVLKPNDTILITNRNERVHLTHTSSKKRTQELAMGEDIINEVKVKPLYKRDFKEYRSLMYYTPLKQRDRIIDSLSLPILKYINEYGKKRQIDPSVTQLYTYHYMGMRYHAKLTTKMPNSSTSKAEAEKSKAEVVEFYKDSLSKWAKEFNCNTCTNVQFYNLAAKKVFNLLYDKLEPAEHLNAISKQVTGNTREFLLSAYMSDLIENNGKDLNNLLAIYNKLCTSKELKKIVNDNYLLTSGGKSLSKGSTMLMTSDKKQISFNDLLKSHKGKIVYIDFWASWCTPCLEEFPFSFKLRNNLMDTKNVSMIYISTDRDFNSWVKMAQNKKLPGSNSYILMNTGKDELSKTLDLNTLPRYLIANKEGKFIYPNASRPSEPKTYQLLKTLAEK